MSDKKEKKTKRERQDEDLQVLNSIIAQAPKKQSVGPTQIIAYSLGAVPVTLGPMYLFSTLYRMNGEEYYPIFAFVALISVILLAAAYHFVFNELYLKKMSKVGSSDKKSADFVSRESMWFSVIYNNLFFLGLFILLGSFVLRFLPPTYNYPLSSTVAAGLVLLSASFS